MRYGRKKDRKGGERRKVKDERNEEGKEIEEGS